MDFSFIVSTRIAFSLYFYTRKLETTHVQIFISKYIFHLHMEVFNNMSKKVHIPGQCNQEEI
jgi:hypothetical protein